MSFLPTRLQEEPSLRMRNNPGSAFSAIGPAPRKRHTAAIRTSALESLRTSATIGTKGFSFGPSINSRSEARLRSSLSDDLSCLIQARTWGLISSDGSIWNMHSLARRAISTSFERQAISSAGRALRPRAMSFLPACSRSAKSSEPRRRTNCSTRASSASSGIDQPETQNTMATIRIARRVDIGRTPMRSGAHLRFRRGRWPSSHAGSLYYSVKTRRLRHQFWSFFQECPEVAPQQWFASACRKAGLGHRRTTLGSPCAKSSLFHHLDTDGSNTFFIFAS